MNTVAAPTFEDFTGSLLLPSQYNDLVRRRSVVLDGEYRLLWAVLNDAIWSYLANMDCSTRNRRLAFEEVRGWLRPHGKARGLFAFQTICDLLGIDSGRLLHALESIPLGDLPTRRHRIVHNARPRRLSPQRRRVASGLRDAARHCNTHNRQETGS
jgi:hypothetical protein